jgi:hypothetical protein
MPRRPIPNDLWSASTRARPNSSARCASQCLDRRIDDKETILAEVAAWQQRRNVEGAQIQWMFTTEKAREKLRKAYPVKES